MIDVYISPIEIRSAVLLTEQFLWAGSGVYSEVTLCLRHESQTSYKTAGNSKVCLRNHGPKIIFKDVNYFL